jgi:hypothetical protein
MRLWPRKKYRLWKYDSKSGIRIKSDNTPPEFWTFRGACRERLRLNKACRSARLPYRFAVERIH